ncbi:MAG TPA: IPT/TIG domain-containing protein [Actinomycetes bacterium]
MPDGDQTPLYDRLGQINASQRGRYLELGRWLSSPEAGPVLAAVRSFHVQVNASLEPESGDGLSDPGPTGFAVDAEEASAVRSLLSQHPAFGDGSKPEIGLDLFGEPLGPDADLVRGEAAELLLGGIVAIAVGGEPIGGYIDSLYHIIVGADGVSGLLKGALLGKAFPETFVDPPRIPKDLLDLLHDIDRRTCGIAIEEAASRWGQAASSGNVGTSFSTGITGLSPSTGCAGTVVTISGVGFPSPAPSDLQVMFPRHGGGCTPASSVQWMSSTAILATAPANVGRGCVGFVQGATGGQPMAEAASTLAGELTRCLGQAAFAAAHRFETMGSHPIVSCPPCLPSGANWFSAGPPDIERFLANNSPDAEVAPGGRLELTWLVHGATAVDIVAVQVQGTVNEHPAVPGPLNAMSGTYVIPSMPGTFAWDREYELQARNACTPAAKPETRRVKIRMRSQPDLTVAGIEVTQAIQFFAANDHMLNPNARRPDNDVALLEGKPTIVRVFVDSGQPAGFENGQVTGVRARLHGKDANGKPLLGSPLFPLDATFTPNPNRAITARRRTTQPTDIAAERLLPANRCFLFLLPSSWTAWGSIDLKAEVLMPIGVPERDTGNNTAQQTVVFNRGGLPVRLAVLRVAWTDPGTGTPVASPNLFQVLSEADNVQRVYPTTRALLRVDPCPGTNPWVFPGNLAAAGISCGAGWNELIAELILRAFFTFGLEDHVYVAMLDGTAASAAAGSVATGCGTPLSSMGLAYLTGAALAWGLLGPLAALALARIGTCAIGAAATFIGTPAAGPHNGAVGTIQQEIGHGFGHFHIPGSGAPPPYESGWPNYQAGAPYESIGEFGLDIDDFLGLPPALTGFSPRVFPLVPVATTDFMSYAGPNWTSPFIYERLMTGATTPPPQVAVPSPGPPTPPLPQAVEPRDVGLLRGSVTEEGVSLHPVYVHQRAARFLSEQEASDDDGHQDHEHTRQSPYRLELRDRAGSVLYSDVIMPLAEQHTGEVRPGFGFAIAFPWFEQTARIAITYQGEELAGINVPLELPRLEPPRVERGENGVVVHWAASHPEDQELRYMVRYATDEESQWRFVAADLTESRLEIPAGSLPGSARGRIQVGASTGGRTTWAESETFEIEPSVPETVILAPTSGAEITAGEEISFRGEAMTIEHGLLNGGALSWRSRLDGELGSGSHLRASLTSPGEHIVELLARSPAGPEAVATIRVLVPGKPGRAAE